MSKFLKLSLLTCVLLLISLHFSHLGSQEEEFYGSEMPYTEKQAKTEATRKPEQSNMKRSRKKAKRKDFLAQYNKLLLGETSSIVTVDCKSWIPVPSSKHPFVLPRNHQEVQRLRPSQGAENGKHRRESFKEIFDHNLWGRETKSGPGSSLSATNNIRAALGAVIDRIKLHLNKNKISVLDSSCGDMTWMPLFLSSRSDLVFTGFDIVKQNIRNHKKRFRDTDWKFEVHDIVTDEIKNSYDLIISRHTTQHLVLSDVVKVIRNFVGSSSKFLLTSSYPNTKINKKLDVDESYRHRPLNFYLEPFYFPPPVCLTPDGNEDCIMLWDLSTISLENPPIQSNSLHD